MGVVYTTNLLFSVYYYLIQREMVRSCETLTYLYPVYYYYTYLPHTTHTFVSRLNSYNTVEPSPKKILLFKSR